MQIDGDALSIVWDYLDFESQLIFRQIEPRVVSKTIRVDTDCTCHGEVIKRSPYRTQFCQRVEDVHRYCEHREIRAAARLYANNNDATRRAFTSGKYAGRRIENVVNNTYLQKFLETRPNDVLYTAIHEILCDRMESPPATITFGKHRGVPYAELPREYLRWLTDANVNVVDNAAARTELQKRHIYVADQPSRKRLREDWTNLFH